MKFKIDENLPLEIAEVLCGEGHDAVTVLEENMGGSPDADIIDACNAEKRVLMTLDMDFSDIRGYLSPESPGIVVLRVHPQHKNHLLLSLRRIIPVFEKEPVKGKLWIVEEDRIRVREQYSLQYGS